MKEVGFWALEGHFGVSILNYAVTCNIFIC